MLFLFKYLYLDNQFERYWLALISIISGTVKFQSDSEK